MSDQEKLDKLKEIRDKADPFSLQDLESALPIIESLEDRDDRDSYICMSAEWLANTCEAIYLDRALKFVRSSSLPIAKYPAFIKIARRLKRENRSEEALSILSEAEIVIEEWVMNNDYLPSYPPIAWNEVADAYIELGDLTKAKRAWDRSIKLAQVGQYDSSPQEAHDCIVVLHNISKKLSQNGFKEEAVQVAQSIRNDNWGNNWRSVALRELDKKE